ncbi:hypothetical protein BDB01DRAFT_717375 [Pilobolus umbonatus]|nr:hypothetical protein BDB01DRAFT_717375 [Pilobolus umbonatus]
MLNVNPLQLSHPEFRIRVENDHIILRGLSEESSGAVLRGSVLLNCHEQIKVRSITLKFIGKVNVCWGEAGQEKFMAERTVIEKEWSFLPSTKKAYHLADTQHEWQFELPLPGNLPQSINHDLGQVTYLLKAHCDRPTFSMNYIDKKKIEISRQRIPTNIELGESLAIANVWANKLNYNISVPAKVFTANTIIPIHFNLNPIAPNINIKSINCFLREYTTFTYEGTSKTENKLITFNYNRKAGNNQISNHCVKTEHLKVPKHIRYDMNDDLLKVRHKIKFTVILENKDGHVSELRAAMPVIIVSSINYDDENTLPRYEANIGRCCVNMSSYNNPPLDGPDNSSSASLSWMGTDISRVPSYRTAIRTAHIPLYISPSLPSYESTL